MTSGNEPDSKATHLVTSVNGETMKAVPYTLDNNKGWQGVDFPGFGFMFWGSLYVKSVEALEPDIESETWDE